MARSSFSYTKLTLLNTYLHKTSLNKHNIIVRIAKNKKTIGSFNLIFYKNQNENDDEMLKLFASKVELFIDKKNSEQRNRIL